MSIRIANQYLESQIAREAQRRGHKAMSQTLEELAIERLRDIQHELRTERKSGKPAA